MFRNILISALLAYVPFISKVSALEDAIRYRLISQKNAHFEPKSTTALLRMNADIYFRPTNKYHEYSVSISPSIDNGDFGIILENGDEVNLLKCPFMTKTGEKLILPYLAGYLDNGLLIYIKTHQTDERLSMNLKFLIASLLQFNRWRLPEGKAPASKNSTAEERTDAGRCPVIYDITEKKDSNETTYLINKDYDLNLCSEVVHNPLDKNYGCLNDVCSTGPERGYDSREKMIMNTRSKDLNLPSGALSRPLVEFLSFDQALKYTAWKNSSLVFHFDTTGSVELNATGQFPEIVPFVDKKSIVIESFEYRVPDEPICDSSNNGPLKILTQGLGCGGYAANLFMDLFDKGTRCSKEKGPWWKSNPFTGKKNG